MIQFWFVASPFYLKTHVDMWRLVSSSEGLDSPFVGDIKKWHLLSLRSNTYVGPRTIQVLDEWILRTFPGWIPTKNVQFSLLLRKKPQFHQVYLVLSQSLLLDFISINRIKYIYIYICSPEFTDLTLHNESSFLASLWGFLLFCTRLSRVQNIFCLQTHSTGFKTYSTVDWSPH